MSYRIYPKDLATLQDIAYFRYMTAQQIQRVHHPEAKDHRSITRRLSNLADQYDQQTGKLKNPRYVSYVFLHDRAAPVLGRPRRVFHIAPHNLKQIEDAYKKRGQYQDYKHTYADLKATPRPADGWAAAHLKHELAITDYGLNIAKLSYAATC